MSNNQDLRNALRVADKKVRLADIDPAGSHGWEEDVAKEAIAHQLARLTDLQDRLWAEHKHKVLVILQGIDAAGKDGTITSVMTAFNPQGCPVSNFKQPSPEELAHDFLWRIHRKVPGVGEIGVFNRSHYEDVLIVRVHQMVPHDVWSARYDQIRDFEHGLAQNGTTIVKFFLYIDKEEQRQRFQERYDTPKKRWKFSLGDIEERKHWDEYIAAYEDAINKTSTDYAPWYIIPANRNWFRNLAVSSILADTLDDLKPAYPPAAADLPKDLVVK